MPSTVTTDGKIITEHKAQIAYIREAIKKIDNPQAKILMYREITNLILELKNIEKF